jgi:general secretion pathway protein D
VEEFAVFIVPLAEPDNTVLISRDFPVRPDFFEVAPTADERGAAAPRRRTPRAVAAEASTTGGSVREALESRGVSFAVEGSAAFYNRSTGILTVRNTQDQIDLVEELVTDESNERLLVRVDARLVEINQTDLEALSVNGALAGNYNYLAPGQSQGPVSQFAAGAVKAATNLQGASGFRSADGINRIINLNPLAGSAANPANIAPEGNKIGIGGELDGNAFRVLFEALSQKSSADILTAPSIVVENGQQGTITVAREFYYPTEFDEPQVTPPTIVTNTLVVPAWPTEFQARNVGVVLTVRPQITKGNKRVFLDIKPEVTEFDGFINYGSQVLSGSGDVTLVDDGGVLTAIPIPPGTLISNNVINQPVFSVRTVENAQLEIQDGYTMVLGGLIREDISTVEDKVPILGDIPLVGRLFRSKGEQAIKKNLLMFVTVRILRPDGEPFNVDAGAPVAAQAVAR